MIMAHTVPVAVNEVSVAINQDMKALVPDDRFNPIFLLWALRAMHGLILSRVSTAVHGTKRLEVREVEDLPILLVSMPQQLEFAKAAETARRISGKYSDPGPDCLFNSLMQRAFRGEL